MDSNYHFSIDEFHGPQVRGSGNVIEKDLSVVDFHGIEAGGAFEVRCKVGGPPSLRIECEDNILPFIEAKVTDGTLHLRTSGSFSTRRGIVATITTPTLDAFELSGAAKGKVEGIHAQAFNLQVSGAGRFQGDGSFGDLHLDVSGGSTVNLSAHDLKKVSADVSGGSKLSVSGGACEAISLEASGGSQADLAGLEALTASVDANGAANVKVHVTQSLLGEASGAANIRYSGNPSVSVSRSGAASVGRL